MRHSLPLEFARLSVGLVIAMGSAHAAIDLTQIKLPEGYTITVYAENVKGARSMTLGPDRTLYVGTRSEGKVYAIPDRNGDGRGDSVSIVAQGLNSPNGVAYRHGALFIAEVSRILRIDSIEGNLTGARPVVVTSALPTDGHHGWKFIKFGPDGKLYVPVGAPCNICNRPEEPKYASILRMYPDGTGLEVFASGVRNSVGFDWHPTTGELWFTDNGRDMLGDDTPADELNRAPLAGMHFGYPFCHAGTVLDPELGAGRSCSSFIAPERKLSPHGAALGMRFYMGSMFPAEKRGAIFIAEHGSWNRTTPIGYRVMQVKAGANAGDPMSYTVFAEGWLQRGRILGRPVDVQVAADGSLLVSDDYAGVIYRITYTGITGLSGGASPSAGTGPASVSTPRPRMRP